MSQEFGAISELMWLDDTKLRTSCASVNLRRAIFLILRTRGCLLAPAGGGGLRSLRRDTPAAGWFALSPWKNQGRVPFLQCAHAVVEGQSTASSLGKMGG